MSTTMIEGLFRAEMGLASNRPIDMEPALGLLEPSRNANFERILRKLEGGKVAKKRMKFEWRRRNLMPMTCKVTAVNAVGDTAITVDDYKFIHRDVLLYNTRSKELYLCNEDAAVAPNATVEVRSYSHATPGTAAIRYATAVGDVINILGEAHAEGEDLPETFRTEETEDFDYIMQIDRRAADITDIADNEQEYDPRGQRDLDNRLAMIEYMRNINLMLYVSQSTREVSSASGARRHAMGGMRQKIVTNRIALEEGGIGLTTLLLGEILRKTKYQGASSANKVALTGQYGLQSASAWPNSAIRVSPLDKSWGMDIQTVITPHGNVELAYDPMLSDEFGLADVMVIFDPAYVRQVYLQGLGLTLVKKIANLSTIHRIVDGITGTFGLQVKFEELHAWVEGIH